MFLPLALATGSVSFHLRQFGGGAWDEFRMTPEAVWDMMGR
jgi:hypothetical protein